MITYEEEEVMFREALDISRRTAIYSLPALLLVLWWSSVPLFRILTSGVAFLALLLISNLAILYVTRWHKKKTSANENL
jgi:hypothetical protein